MRDITSLVIGPTGADDDDDGRLASKWCALISLISLITLIKCGGRADDGGMPELSVGARCVFVWADEWK